MKKLCFLFGMFLATVHMLSSCTNVFDEEFLYDGQQSITRTAELPHHPTPGELLRDLTMRSRIKLLSPFRWTGPVDPVIENPGGLILANWGRIENLDPSSKYKGEAIVISRDNENLVVYFENYSRYDFQIFSRYRITYSYGEVTYETIVHVGLAPEDEDPRIYE